ncbi:hypothetical protein BaRGS_00027279, partial [Batillaria attramentaria]
MMCVVRAMGFGPAKNNKIGFGSGLLNGRPQSNEGLLLVSLLCPAAASTGAASVSHWRR